MNLTSADWVAIGVTLKLACMSTLLLLLLATPLAWWLARSRSPFAAALQAVVALPLVLPPTVLGFYLLVFFSPNGWIGGAMDQLGLKTLPFTFTGLVVGSMVYSLPFAVQPIQNAFRSIGQRPLDVAAMLGASPWDRFWSVCMPLSKAGFVSAAVLSFAHTLGEFGVILMIGGNIPGETQVLSVLIYDRVQGLDYQSAHRLSLLILGFSFALLLVVYGMGERSPLVGGTSEKP